jgi:histidine phosphotransfer protein HptB
VSESIVLDGARFDELVASTNADVVFLGMLLETYFGDAPQFIAEMRTSLAAGDAETFRRAAHSLKSNSATWGAMNLAALALELEVMGKERTLDGAAPKIDRVEAEYARVKAALEQRVAALGAGA